MGAILTHIPLFRTLPRAELKTLAATCELRRFRKGEAIFTEGQPADAVWIVTRGWVYLMKGTLQGGLATIFAMTPSEPLCGISAFDHGTYSATAVAATDTRLIVIRAEVFSDLLDRYPIFSRQVLLTCCKRIRRMAEAISLAHAPVEQRIAYILLRLKKSFGHTLPVTHHELAKMVGTRWETSIRTLSAMKQHGWVASSRGRITILAPRSLYALLRDGKSPERNGPHRHEGKFPPV